jgi:hypothetical protein
MKSSMQRMMSSRLLAAERHVEVALHLLKGLRLLADSQPFATEAEMGGALAVAHEELRRAIAVVEEGVEMEWLPKGQGRGG